MQSKEIICTVCPVGCRITVVGDGDEIRSICGNTCQRGEVYAKNEFIRPVRLLTSVVKVLGHEDTPLLAVRSNRPVPKDKIFQCMDEIRAVCVNGPVKRGDIIIQNIAGTEADIISCSELA